MTTTRRGPSIPSLDGLRAVSITIVFLSHNQGFGDVFPGAFGVTVFFVLSGYLITTLLRAEVDEYGSVDLRSFYVRRAFRILPPLYAFLLLVPLLVRLGWTGNPFDVRPWAAQMLQLANYWQVLHPARFGVEGTQVLWSLAVEEHFYLVFPGAFAVMMRRGWHPARQVRWLVGACAAVLAWRVALVCALHVSTVRTALATDTRLDSMLLGCAAALVGNPAVAGDRVRRGRLAATAVLGGAAILATLAVRDDVFRETVRYTVQSLAVVGIIRYVVAAPTSLVGRVLNLRPVRWFGRTSYGFYLVHLFVLREFERHVQSRALRLSVGFVLATVAAWALHAILDGPSHRLRARALERAARPAWLATPTSLS